MHLAFESDRAFEIKGQVSCVRFMSFVLISSSRDSNSSEVVIECVSSTLLRKREFRSTDIFTLGGRQAVEFEKHALYF